jgi:cytochrome bd-type quinol oxidase subunit 2
MLASAFVAGLVLTGLLLPFLAGMVITAIRSGRKPGFAELLQGGLVEYGRQFRLLIIGGVVVLLAFAAGSALLAGVEKSAAKAIVESDLDTMSLLANLGFYALLAISMSVLDAARAQFAADSTLRSAFKAYGRGVKQLVRRPIATIGLFVLITIVGLLLVALFGVLRLSAPGLLLGFIATQLVVLATIWMRTARLYALTEVATSR